MNNELTYLIAQLHGAELRHGGERARRASESRATRRILRRPNLIAGLRRRSRRGSPPEVTTAELEPVIASER
jgi:hypothetical protein